MSLTGSHRAPSLLALAEVGSLKHTCNQCLTSCSSPSGSAGFVAINNQNSDWDATFTSQLAGGSYCDVTSGNLTNNACTGTEYVVCKTREHPSEQFLIGSLFLLVEASL